MKIIISPAKKMNYNPEALPYHDSPRFLEDTKMIAGKMQALSLEEAKALWKCNDKLAKQNYDRFQHMKLDESLTPAILSYEGIQYQYMAPTVFENEMLDYIQKHLCILSGFYGVLRPMDGVTPYRLEMQAKFSVGDKKNLYEFWNDSLYQAVVETDREVGNPITIINLASKEYSICVEKYLKPDDQYITCIFGEIVGGKVAQKGTYAKMARGEMVRFMAENQIENTEDIKNFNRLGYSYNEELSTEYSYVFIKSSTSEKSDS